MNSRPVVLVTGSSRGLGRGIAVCCARAGFDVAIHFAGNESAAQETIQLCQSSDSSQNQRFQSFQANIGIASDRIRLFDQLLSYFGRLDALVNNAGMAPRVRADIMETGEESYDE